MKKLLTFIMACVISLGATAQISEKAFEKWHQNKYSMFIHFGLYSMGHRTKRFFQWSGKMGERF